MKPIRVDSMYRCLKEQCPFSEHCSQHISANEKRQEDGFKPDLLIDIDNGDILCKSIDSQPSTQKGTHKIIAF